MSPVDPLRRIARTVVCCAVMMQSTAAFAAAVVEGEAGLLEVLRAAQETNATLFPSGQMSVRTSEAVAGEEAEAVVRWSGPRIRWDDRWTTTIPRSAAGKVRPEDLGRRMPARTMTTVEVPGAVMTYEPGVGRAWVSTGTKPGAGYSDILKVCPRQSWYREDGPYSSERSEWRVRLDPSQAPDTVEKFVVSRRPEDLVEVEIRYRSGSSLRSVASLRHGGNIVEYEKVLGEEALAQVPQIGLFWREGRYEWAPTAGGQWYLKHFEFRRAANGDPATPDFDFRMDVDQFDPNARFGAKDFTLTALKLPQGTVITETGKRERTYRIGRDGREEAGLPSDQLDALGERLRASGFAEPERARD